MAEEREMDGYWLVWTRGMEWPEQFYSERMARDRVSVLAKTRLGYAVHICKLQSVGTMMIPMNVTVEGVMRQDATN